MFESSTPLFRRVVLDAGGRARQRGGPAVEVADLLRELLDRPDLDGSLFLAHVGVDVVGATARAARAFPDPQTDTGLDLAATPAAAGPPFTVESKAVISTALDLQRETGCPHLGTEHLAASLLLSPSKATAVLAAPSFSRRKICRALRGFASGAPQGGPRHEQLVATLDRADACLREGAIRSTFAILHEIGPALAANGHPELAARAALIEVGAAHTIDEASFVAALARAEPVVAAAGSAAIDASLRSTVAGAALGRGDAAPTRSLVADVEQGIVTMPTAIAAMARADLLVFDGDLDGARRTLADELDSYKAARSPMIDAILYAELAGVARLAERLDEAGDLARRALALLDREHPLMAIVQVCGGVLALLGQPDARPPLEWVSGVAYDNGSTRRFTTAQLGLCVLSARTEPGPAAEQALAHVAGQLDEQGLRLVAIEARLERARLAVVMGRPEEAIGHLDDAEARARAIGSRGWATWVDVVRRELVGG